MRKLTGILPPVLFFLTTSSISYAAGADCGVPLSTYKGVAAFSNGEMQGTFRSCSSEASLYGNQFDSLEFAMRFFGEALGIAPKTWESDPRDLMGTAICFIFDQRRDSRDRLADVRF